MPARATVEHLKLMGDHNNKVGREYNDAHGELITTDTMIKAPRKYSQETVDAWGLVTSNLIAMQSLTEADLPLLKAMFDAYDDYVKLRKLYKKHIVDVEASTDELMKQTTIHQKLFTTMNTARETFNKIASKFGLTPVDRSKLPINGGEKKEDVLDIVLNG